MIILFCFTMRTFNIIIITETIYNELSRYTKYYTNAIINGICISVLLFFIKLTRT